MRVYDSLLKPATNVTHFVPVFYYVIRESHTSVYCTVVSTCNLVDKRIYEWNGEIIYFIAYIYDALFELTASNKTVHKFYKF